MQRTLIDRLSEWKNRKGHKPLIIRGARQVGKTWLMKHFAETEYDNYVYVNFDDNEILNNVFVKDFDIKRILTAISVSENIDIDEHTLIIFDEIQEAPRGITALKYFEEKAPQYDIIAAGSLLGIAMHSNDSFPVGKVEFLDLYPLSFVEFIDALGEKRLLELLKSCDWDMIAATASKYEQLLRLYFFVGGMPGVVADYVENRDLNRVRMMQQNILDTYDRDFSKHAPNNEVPRLRMVWKSIVGQLSKENRKFIYGFLKEGARAKDFELSIEWLRDAGLLYKVNRSKCGLMPLAAYEDFSAFKVFMVDIGLMCAMCKLPSQTVIDGDRLFTDFKGALTEQYVMQQLVTIEDTSIYYWSADNSRGEIDFLIQHNGTITPIEVKAAENLQSKSLRAFVDKHSGLHGLRLSMSNYREQEWMTNVPLYCVRWAI